MFLHFLESFAGDEIGFEFEVECKVMELPLKVEVVDVDKQSQNLTQNVPPDQSLEGSFQDHVSALDRIFGSNISICNSCDYT